MLGRVQPWCAVCAGSTRLAVEANKAPHDAHDSYELHRPMMVELDGTNTDWLEKDQRRQYGNEHKSGV